MPLGHACLVDLQSLGHLDLASEVFDCVLCFHASIMPVVICLCSLFFPKNRQRSMHISYQGEKHMNWGFFMQSTGTRVKALRVSKRVKKGKYIVSVKFILSKDGNLSDIACENDPGFGMCEEVIRVLKKITKWTPAEPVKVREYRVTNQ